MKAAVVHDFTESLRVEEVLDRTPGDEQVPARGGRLICVELPAENDITLPIFQTVLGGLSLKGSIVGTHHDLEEVFELHRRGETRVLRAERSLDHVNEAIAEVLDGSAPEPRLVFDMEAVGTAHDHVAHAGAGAGR